MKIHAYAQTAILAIICCSVMKLHIPNGIELWFAYFLVAILCALAIPSKKD